MNLYDKLLKLQVIDNAFIEWESYRTHLTQYIIDHTTNNESIAIFGAGRCNDIDLKMLTFHFNKVILLDKDEEAMKTAIFQYQLGHSPIIETKVVDFVGISNEDYRLYADSLVNEIRRLKMNTDCHELAKIALIQLELLQKKILAAKLNFGVDLYENTVVIGVHSQLLSILEWIWSIMLQAINESEESVRTKIIEMNHTVVRKFNDALLKATKSTLIIGCEKERLGIPGTIQGAIQALNDTGSRSLRNEFAILDSRDIPWSFNKSQGVEYMMQIQTIAFPKKSDINF